MSYSAMGSVLLKPLRDDKGHIVPNRWTQEEPIHVYSYDDPILRIPEGFETDLASVPRAFWIMTGGKTGKHQRAAVCHDYAYRQNALPKEWADDMFYDIMRLDGVSRFRAWIMWKAVRVFGGGPYQERA